MSTVQTRMKDRCSSMRATVRAGEYEYGWLTVNRRDRSKDVFRRVGCGTFEEAQEWMRNPGIRTSKYVAGELARRG